MNKDKELKARNMMTRSRLGIYLIAWMLLVIITGFISADGIFRPIDEYFFKEYYVKDSISNNTEQLKKLFIVDIPRDYNSNYKLNVPQARMQTARLLNTIDTMVRENSGRDKYEKPSIILDVTYGPNNDSISKLKVALANLKNISKVKVYGAYPSPTLNSNIKYNDHEETEVNSDLYDRFFEGDGDRFHVQVLNKDDCLHTYETFLRIDRESNYEERIESLVERFGNDLEPLSKKTDLDNEIRIPINTQGLIEKFNDRTFEFNDTISLRRRNIRYPEFDKDFDLNGSIIIIGQFDKDKFKVCDESEEIPGPYILASSLINKLDNNKSIREAHDNVPVQLGMCFLFSLLVCLFFALIYKYAKSLKTKPLLISLFAFLIGIVILIGFGYALLQWTIIRPALPTVGMFWAAFLSWRFSNKFLITGIVEGSEKYDIFISYSFGNSDYAKELYEKLSKLTKANGKKVDIFFAEKSIGVGELFVSKYMKAIVDSKLFIPVMSEEYYKKNHCKNEMDLAVKRKIEEHINIFILAFDPKHVPAQYSNILWKDAEPLEVVVPEIQETVKALDSSSNEEKSESTELEQKEEKKIIPKESSGIIPKGGANIEPSSQNKVWFDSNELAKKGIESEQWGKGIIIINNSSGQLTLNASGGTISLNDDKIQKKKKKKKKKHRSNEKKNKKRRKKVTKPLKIKQNSNKKAKKSKNKRKRNRKKKK